MDLTEGPSTIYGKQSVLSEISTQTWAWTHAHELHKSGVFLFPSLLSAAITSVIIHGRGKKGMWHRERKREQSEHYRSQCGRGKREAKGKGWKSHQGNNWEKEGKLCLGGFKGGGGRVKKNMVSWGVQEGDEANSICQTWKELLSLLTENSGNVGRNVREDMKEEAKKRIDGLMGVRVGAGDTKKRAKRAGSSMKKLELHMEAVKVRQRAGCHQLQGFLWTCPVAFNTVIVLFWLLWAWGRDWSREEEIERGKKRLGRLPKAANL